MFTTILEITVVIINYFICHKEAETHHLVGYAVKVSMLIDARNIKVAQISLDMVM